MNSYEQTPFDWSLVDKLNPEVIIGQSEIKLVRSFVKMILNTDFQGLPQTSFVNRDFSKLLILFQATIKLLYTSQKQLQNLCNDRTKKYKESCEEIAKLKQSEASLRKHLHNEQCQGETCPLCKKRFKNLEYIDKHIKNRHIERLEAWQFVRGLSDSLNNESKNNNSNIEQEKKEIKLKFMACSSITIDNSMSQKMKKEQRVFELDEEEAPNNNDNFVYNNYIKSQVPPNQKEINKTHHQISSDDSNITINQIGISNNDQIAKSQIDMITNRAATNIINGYKEIAESHKNHYSSPQTPKENPSKHYDNDQLPNSPLSNPNYPKSKTPDQGKRTKVVMNIPTEQAQTPIQHKERHHHHRQQQQQIQQQQQQQQLQQQIQQQQLQIQQQQQQLQQLQQLQIKQQQQQLQQLQQQQLQIQQNMMKENRPQTPPAISCRKQSNNDEQEHRPSTTGSAIQEAQKYQKSQQKYQQQPPQIQQQQKQSQIQQQQKQSQIQQQPKQSQIQQQQIQQDQNAENEENDPFLLDNDDEPETKPQNTNHIEFTNDQLDDLIQRSDNEDGNDEVEVRSQTPKKRRKKRRTVIQMPDGSIPQNGEIASTAATVPTVSNNTQEVKFNFKGPKNSSQQQNQQDAQETDMLDENQKMKARKPSVTFINDDENYERKLEEKVIVNRLDVKPIIDEHTIKPAVEIKNNKHETKTVKRMGGFEIANSELENLIFESSRSDEYDE